MASLEMDEMAAGAGESTIGLGKGSAGMGPAALASGSTSRSSPVIQEAKALPGADAEAPAQAWLHQGTDDELVLTGYRLNRLKVALTSVLFVLTAGLLWLVLYWMPKVRLCFTHSRVSLELADTVLVEQHYREDCTYVYVKKIYISIAGDGGSKENFAVPKASSACETTWAESLRFFKCKKVMYIWDTEQKFFYELKGLDKQVPVEFFHRQVGLAPSEQKQRRNVYGPNNILVPNHSVSYLLIQEVLNPFYVFQIASVILWMSDEYYYYGVAIILMSVGGVGSAVYQTKQNQANMRSTIQSSDFVTVKRRDGTRERIQSEDLVPGDIIVIPATGAEMTCDGVLISGTAIVNEAMLTGESVPVTKTTIEIAANLKGSSSEIYNDREHQRHTLFRGTTVIQTRNYKDHETLAFVIRTGFCTSKGNLIRSILYPVPVDYKFEQDSYKFVGFLICLAIAGFAYTVYLHSQREEFSFLSTFLDAADLITIAIPPALPAAITIGSIYAERRLKNKGIFCISPRSINVAGSLNCVCFDKTGTMTEDGLDLLGVVRVQPQVEPSSSSAPTLETQNGKDSVQNGHSLRASQDGLGVASRPVFQGLEKSARELGKECQFLQGMATCHSLTLINDELIGDPMDLIMFEGTGWILEDQQDHHSSFDNLFATVVRPPLRSEQQSALDKVSGNHDNKLHRDDSSLSVDWGVGIIRQFQFSSERQCMSVIVKGLDDTNYSVFCKGSPEKIKSISIRNSLPSNFDPFLESFTEKGYRVIALAKKLLPDNTNYRKIQRMSRSEVEQDLTFLGLIVLENRIKKETTPVIRELHRANMRTIMVTGDHIQTAVSVAKECQMIPNGCKVIFVTAIEKMGKAFISFNQAGLSASQESVASLSRSTTTILEDVSVSVSLPDQPPAEAEDMIDDDDYHFAMDGPSFDVIRKHFPEEAQRIWVKCKVFARMSPDQKEILIGELQKLGFCVAMCGDGANDCGALKTAHTGVSLSEAEASVASPFTSKEPNISCIPQLVRQGRCALVTSFGIFKYMAGYSMTQFMSVLILYHVSSDLGDMQYLYIDLFLITVFAIFFGLTKPYEGELAKKPPLNSLIHAIPMTSLLLQMVLVLAFQLSAILLTHEQAWFLPFNSSNTNYSGTPWEDYYSESTISDSEYASWENFSIFAVSAFQYFILAYAFSKSKPYRQWTIRNFQLMASFLVMGAFTIYLILYPAKALQRAFEMLLPPDMDFRLTLLGLSALNLALCLLVEDVFVEIWFWKLFHSLKELFSSREEYLIVREWLKRHPEWPPLSAAALPVVPSDPDDNAASAIVKTHIDFEILEENEVTRTMFQSNVSPKERAAGGPGEGLHVSRTEDGPPRVYDQKRSTTAINAPGPTSAHLSCDLHQPETTR